MNIKLDAIAIIGWCLL